MYTVADDAFRHTHVCITPPSPGRHNIVTATTKLNPPINSRTTEETTTAAAAAATTATNNSNTGPPHNQQHQAAAAAPSDLSRAAYRHNNKTRHCIAAVAAAVGFTTPSSALVQIRYITNNVVLLSVLTQVVVEVAVILYIMSALPTQTEGTVVQ